MILLSISIKKYLDRPTDIYHLVDESFISRFNEKQGSFMLIKYYSEYKLYCKNNGLKKQDINSFIKSARRKKIKIIQVFCPYCGNIEIVITRESCQSLLSHQYCTRCGKRSAVENVFFQLSSLLRMQAVHSAGLNALESKYTKDEQRIMEYDIKHMELIDLTCIFEATLRNFYFEMMSLEYNVFKSSYLFSTIKKDIKNDFMNIDKAAVHFKKALNIDIKGKLDENCVSSLRDMVNIRNTLVHNNGMIDDSFKNSETYVRMKDSVNGNLIFLNDKDIEQFFKNILLVVQFIENEFYKIFNEKMPLIIANHYFNELSEDEKNGENKKQTKSQKKIETNKKEQNKISYE